MYEHLTRQQSSNIDVLYVAYLSFVQSSFG